MSHTWRQKEVFFLPRLAVKLVSTNANAYSSATLVSSTFYSSEADLPTEDLSRDCDREVARLAFTP